MSLYKLISFAMFVSVYVLQVSLVECRPRTQRIVVHGHEWTVPNEPGWSDVLQEAENIRQRFLSNCASSRDCRLAVEKLEQVFLKHPISANYYHQSLENIDSDNDAQSIFKWG